MAVPSNYRTGAVDVGANTYSKPVQSGIGEALSGVVTLFGQAEQKKTLTEEERRLQTERDDFFGQLTPAQKQIISINEAVVEGRELTKEEIEFRNQSSLLQEAVEQGVMKTHQFKRRQEAMLRDAKQARPDLAQEFDKLYSDTLGFDVRGAAMDYYNYNLKLTENLARSSAQKEADALKAEQDWVSDVIRNESVYTKDMSPQDAARFRNELKFAHTEFGTGGRPDLTGLRNTLGIATGTQAKADEAFRVGTLNPETGERTKAGKAVLDESIAIFGQAAAGIEDEILSGKWNPDSKVTQDRINNMEKNINMFEGEIAKWREVPSLGKLIAPYEEQVKFLRTRIESLRKDATPQNIQQVMQSSKLYLQGKASASSIVLADDTIKYMKANNMPFNEEAVRSTILEASGWSSTLQENGTQFADMYMPQHIASKLSPIVFPAVASALTVGELGGTQKAAIVASATEAAAASGAPVRASSNGREIPKDPNQLMARNGVIGHVLANKDSLRDAKTGMDVEDRHAFAASLLMNLDRYNVARVKDAVSSNPDLPRDMRAGAYAETFFRFKREGTPEKMSSLSKYAPVSSGFVEYRDAIAPRGTWIDHDRKAQDFLNFVINDLILGAK